MQDKCAGCLVPASSTSSFHSKISRVFLNWARWNRKYSTKFHIGLPATYKNPLSAEFSRKTGFRCQLREVVSDRSMQRTLVYRSLAVLPGAPCLMPSFCRERLLIAARLEQYRYYREAGPLARFGTHNASLFLPVAKLPLEKSMAVPPKTTQVPACILSGKTHKRCKYNLRYLHSQTAKCHPVGGGICLRSTAVRMTSWALASQDWEPSR